MIILSLLCLLGNIFAIQLFKTHPSSTKILSEWLPLFVSNNNYHAHLPLIFIKIGIEREINDCNIFPTVHAMCIYFSYIAASSPYLAIIPVFPLSI